MLNHSKGKLQHIVWSAEKITAYSFPSIQELYESRVRECAGKIIAGFSHTGHHLFQKLHSSYHLQTIRMQLTQNTLMVYI